MGISDRAEHVAKEITGKVKEVLGEMTANEALRVEGEAEAEAAREDLRHAGEHSPGDSGHQERPRRR